MAKIDEIIDLLHQMATIRVAEWYVPDYDSSLVCVVLFDGEFNNTMIDLLEINLLDANYLEWDVSSTYMLVDTWGDLPSIYMDFDQRTPKNKRWVSARNIQVHLYFKHDEVGLPEDWTKRMRKIDAGHSQKVQ